MSAKEKIISELNMELHNIETTLTNEREQHVNEIKKLNMVLNEKVGYFLSLCCFHMFTCIHSHTDRFSLLYGAQKMRQTSCAIGCFIVAVLLVNTF